MSTQDKTAKTAYCVEDNLQGFSSLSVHGGEHKRRPKVSDALTTPIVQTATYWFKDSQQCIDFNEGRYETHEYGRYGNPTARTVELKLIKLESPKKYDHLDALVSASGMASATTMILALVPANGHMVITSDCYRRTRQFITTFLPKMGITCSILDPSDLDGLKKVLEEKEVSLYFSEAPTNPYLRCVDVEKIVELCGGRDTIVAIDTTFATPINFQPLKYGADLTLHSATKYLAGHNDVLAGAIIGKKEIISKIKLMHNILGPVIDPHCAYLLLRGMKTLSLRVKHQNQTALKLATFLDSHEKIDKVWYPGVASHPDHEVAKRLFQNGFGGVVSFQIKGDFDRTKLFIDSLKLPYIGPSLGGVESLVEQPTIVSFWNMSPEQRAKVGIADNLVRFSCGVEDYEDLKSDVESALNVI